MNYANFPYDGKRARPAEEPRDSELIDIEQLLRMAQRQAKIVAICAAIGLMLGFLYLKTTPPTYTASARALIDEGLSRIGDDQTEIPFTLQTDSAVLSQVEILYSARLAGAVVDKLNLTEDERFMNPPSSLAGRIIGFARNVVGALRGADAPSSGEDEASGKRQYAIETLQKKLVAQRVGQTFAVSIGFEATDPQLAAAIANAYADAYLSHELNASFDASERATIWMRDRIENLRVNSVNAAREVEDYRAKHGLAASQGQLLAEKKVADLTTQLIEAQADTAKAEAIYNQFREIVDSGSNQAVANPAITSGQLPTSDISVLKTRYLNVSRREQEISSNFGPEHEQAVALRREQAELTRSIFAEVQRMTDSYRNDFEVAKSREDVLRKAIDDARGSNAEAGKAQVELRELEQQASALRTLYTTFLERYEDTQQKQTFPIGKVRLISEAVVPRAASGPRSSIVLGIALVLGSMIGCGLGALNEFNERFFRTGEDVRERLGVKFLGYMPLVMEPEKPKMGQKPPEEAEAARQRAASRRARMRMAVTAPASMLAETLRNAKLAGDVVLQDTPSKVIGVISMLPGEGKSTVASNFAQLLATSQAKTLLIDCDLRNPGLTRQLAFKASAGVVETVVKSRDWHTLLKHDRQTGLMMLPAIVKRQLSHTSELLASRGMRSLIEQARKEFDYIIVDLPPLGPVIDAKAFEPLADAFLMVIEWGATPRAVVRNELATEPQIAGKLLGVILNKVKVEALGRYGRFGGVEQVMHTYSKYYTSDDEQRMAEVS
ncbi:MAG: polysaccharide biosynthesis tyrosine autokinase [Rhizobiaceae bacterium]|nr:polysaccharide biosynthesis tyrosine autokinase [Rhizobiaceae bacterium]